MKMNQNFRQDGEKIEKTIYDIVKQWQEEGEFRMIWEREITNEKREKPEVDGNQHEPIKIPFPNKEKRV